MNNRVRTYLETALWSSTVLLPVPEEELVDGKMDVDSSHPCYGVVDGEPVDDYFQIKDFSDDAVAKASDDIAKFFQWLESEVLTGWASEYADDERICHDFWLTRNGHGAGFWGGDYGDRLGDILTEKCEEFGELNIIVGNDGQLHFC